jgi:AraC family transcriptional regulator
MAIDIEQMPALRAAAIHHVGSYHGIGRVFGELSAISARAGLDRQPGAQLLAIYHDDPETTPADRLRSDAAIVVAPDAKLPDGLKEVRIPAGRYAKARHTGSYERLGETWRRFKSEWLPASGHRAASGPSLEIYRNTPMTAPPDQLITDLYIPIA